MGTSTLVNKEVEITSVYFRNKQGKQLETYPRRMVYDDREYNFLEDSLRYLVQRGQQLIRLFDVSDGQAQYRLRVDEANHWTLVGIKATA